MTTHFSTRPYQHPVDLDALLALVQSRPAGHLLDFPGPSDLREMLMLPDVQATTRLWESGDGAFAGYALLNLEEEYAGLIFEYSQAFSSSGIGDEMIAWAEAVFRSDYHGQAQQLNTSTHSALTERVSLLEKHGFQREEECALYFARQLAEPIPEPQVPDGFIIRSLDLSEEPAWVALHQAAFGTQNMTLEYRQAMSGMPGYDPALDLVAVAPDGTLAAYVFGAIYAEENALTGEQAGHTDPIATHPRYQRLGLSKALLLAGLRRLKERGITVARLGTSSDNTAMQRTALAAGFRLVGESWHYAKSIPELSTREAGDSPSGQRKDQT